jgi:hypothetical protein
VEAEEEYDNEGACGFGEGDCGMTDCGLDSSHTFTFHRLSGSYGCLALAPRLASGMFCRGRGCGCGCGEQIRTEQNRTGCGRLETTEKDGFLRACSPAVVSAGSCEQAEAPHGLPSEMMSTITTVLPLGLSLTSLTCCTCDASWTRQVLPRRTGWVRLQRAADSTTLAVAVLSKPVHSARTRN